MSLAGVVTRKGAAVTFTSRTAGTYDAATDTTTGATVATVTGHAMQIDGDPDVYESLQLIESDNPTLLFTPTVPGSMPVLGATVVWGGATYVVKNRKPLAMNGTATAAMIVVGK